MLRAGIIGYGYMGEIRRVNIDAHPQLELVGVCDPALLAAGTDLGVPLYEAVDDLLDIGVDVLFVCTPNKVTATTVVRALKRGCHVFSEKPPGRSVDDVRRIIEAERAHPDLKLVFGFNHRYHRCISDAKALVDGGALGKVLWLRGTYGKGGGEDFERSWRNDPELAGGGILLDQGIHMLDLFHFFCGEFDDVRGMVTTAYWDVPMEDNAFVLLRNDRGQIAQLHSSATQWKHTFRLEIGLERGYLVASGLLSKSGSYGRENLVVGRRATEGERMAAGNPREEITYYDDDPSWQIQVNNLVDCVLNDRPVTDSTSADALRAMGIIDRVYRDEGVHPEAGSDPGRGGRKS
jgi:predicted dehydrogenase